MSTAHQDQHQDQHQYQHQDQHQDYQRLSPRPESASSASASFSSCCGGSGGSGSGSVAHIADPQRQLMAALNGTSESGETVLEKARQRLRRVQKTAATQTPEESVDLRDHRQLRRACKASEEGQQSPCGIVEDFEAVIRRARMGLRPPDTRRRPPGKAEALAAAAVADPEDEAALWGSPDFADLLRRRLRGLRPAQEAPAWTTAEMAVRTAARTTAAAAAAAAAASVLVDDTDSQAASDILDCGGSVGGGPADEDGAIGPSGTPSPPSPTPPLFSETPRSGTTTTTEDEDEAAGSPGASRTRDCGGCEQRTPDELRSGCGTRPEPQATAEEATAAAAAAVSASLAVLERSQQLRDSVCRGRIGERCWRLLHGDLEAKVVDLPRQLALSEEPRRRLLAELRICDAVSGEGVGSSGGSAVAASICRLLARNPALTAPDGLSLTADCESSRHQMAEISCRLPPLLPPLLPIETAADAAADAAESVNDPGSCSGHRRLQRSQRLRRLLDLMDSGPEAASEDRSSDSEQPQRQRNAGNADEGLN